MEILLSVSLMRYHGLPSMSYSAARAGSVVVASIMPKMVPTRAIICFGWVGLVSSFFFVSLSLIMR